MKFNKILQLHNKLDFASTVYLYLKFDGFTWLEQMITREWGDSIKYMKASFLSTEFVFNFKLS